MCWMDDSTHFATAVSYECKTFMKLTAGFQSSGVNVIFFFLLMLCKSKPDCLAVISFQASLMWAN
jgi:hypothetical protein